MTAFLLWILSLVLVWNVVPHLFLWSLKGVEVEHKRRASKSFLAASLKGLVVLPFEMLAPIVMLFVLPFVKREADYLPKVFWFWDNNISINGDGWAKQSPDGTWETIRVRGVPNCVPYGHESYTGDAYYAKGHHPRSFWARYVWLGWRNRASKLAEKLGVVVTPELNADRQKWGTEGVNRMAGPTAVRGWSLFRMGSHYQLYAVYDLAFTLCFRFNWGFKVWGADNGEPQAMVVNIAGSIIGDKDDE